MDRIKELWAKKYEPQGRINITIFFVNIFLCLCHIFLMVVYAIIGHKFMIYVNICSLLLFLLYIPHCYKNIERYMGIAFLEVWLHQIFGILSFGWTPCYQNWCFAMIVAYFLPAFYDKPRSARSFVYTFLIIITYFGLATTFPLLNLKITMQLDLLMDSILFIANNLFTFITIALFALFYTSSNKRKVSELTRKADYDELTGMYNRYSLNKISSDIINTAMKENKSYSVAIMDLDYFKSVNDTYGHTSGDDVLKKFALILKSFSKKDMISGRWGGEEFVMIASSDIPYEDFIKVLDNFRVKVSKTKFPIEDNQKINVTVSIGACKVTDYDNLEKVILKADENLYKAKEKGRNRVIS